MVACVQTKSLSGKTSKKLRWLLPHRSQKERSHPLATTRGGMTTRGDLPSKSYFSNAADTHSRTVVSTAVQSIGQLFPKSCVDVKTATGIRVIDDTAFPKKL